jgi:diguanylate cyclase (GGDEF)-like protein/PAS domain S-box-containing protein
MLYGRFNIDPLSCRDDSMNEMQRQHSPPQSPASEDKSGKSSSGPTPADNHLAEQIQTLRSSTDSLRELIFRSLPDGSLTFVNDDFCTCFEKHSRELLGKTFYEFLLPEDRESVRQDRESLSREKPAVTHEYRVIGPGSDIRWHQGSDIALFDRDGNLLGYHSVSRDITEHLQTQEALRQSEEWLRFLMENMGDILWTMGLDLNTTYVSPSVFRVLGYTPEERYQSKVEDQVTAESLERARQRLLEELALEGQPGADPDRSVTIEMEYYHKNGSTVWLENVLRAIRDADDRIIALQGVSRVVTKRREMEEALRETVKRLEELSITDGLSGLYNQRHFYETLGKEMTRAQRYGRPLSLIMIDIDNFKNFNDAYGHMEGDRVIERLGATIRRCSRRPDVACRYGGEEFVVLLPETTAEQAHIMAERMRVEFRAHPFRPRPGETVHKTISIGIAQCENKEDPRSFLNRADTHMYEAKRGGKDQIRPLGPERPVATAPSAAGNDGPEVPKGGKAVIPDRREAVTLLEEHVRDVRLLAHSYASEAVLRALARHLGQNEDLWGTTGLLHDLDIELVEGDLTRHGLEAERMLSERGYDPDMVEAILLHNETASKRPRETALQHALAAGETITGLITATAMVQPDRKLASVKVKSVVKRMKEKAFAASVRRENILECEKIGITLAEFVELSLAAMVSIHEKLGL